MANVTPRTPGTEATSAMTMNLTRRPLRSESADSTTAPTTPATSIRAPIVPASVGVNPRGFTICSTHVVTPLKVLMTMKATSSMMRNGFILRACLRPSNISTRSSSPGGPGGRRGALARHEHEEHRGGRGQRPVDQLHGRDGERVRERRGERHAHGDAEHAGERGEAHRRGALAPVEPVRRHLGPGVEQERLRDGDGDAWPAAPACSCDPRNHGPPRRRQRARSRSPRRRGTRACR